MSGLDYYGRLMRRATARVRDDGVVVIDPFDRTAPWPLVEPNAASSAKPSIDGRVAPAFPSPRAEIVAAAPPAMSVPPSIETRDGARPADAMPPSQRPATPASSTDASSDASSVQQSPAHPPQRITPLRPVEPAAVPLVLSDAPRQARRQDSEERHFAIESAPRLDLAERQADVAVPHVATAGERPSSSAPHPPAPVVARAPMLQPAAPPLRMPISAPPEQAVPAPVISIGEIDIDIDQRAVAAAAPAPTATPHHPSARGFDRDGRVDPGLLRGPNDRAFGIGQV